MLYLLFHELKILKRFCSLWAKLNVLQYGICVADLPWMEIVYMALDSSYLVRVLKAFIIEEFVWQISLLLLEKQKCQKTVICLVLMSRATTSFPKMLKHIAVCISEYHILCGMHILLICLVQVVDEVHLCVQMWTHVFKIFFFLEGGNMEKQLQSFIWAISCSRLSLDINNRLVTTRFSFSFCCW